jgi:uncharacterized membrane protein/Mg-chelatase subunit ChlD
LAVLTTRLLLLTALIYALAEPRRVRRSDSLTVVYTLDASDSMGEKVSDKALSWIIQTAKDRQEKDAVGLVAFGSESAVELPPRQSFPFEGVLNSGVRRDATNLGEALSLSAALLPEGQPGRIVLVSDGNENLGSAMEVVDRLKAGGVAVDVLPVDFSYDKEVWVERLDLPRQNVKEGDTSDAQILVSSIGKAKGRLRVTENDQLIVDQEVELNSGKNRLSVKLPRRTAGVYRYVATIVPELGSDHWAENNSAIGDLYVKGNPRILLVTDAEANVADLEPLAQAFRETGKQTEIRMGYELPRDPAALLDYDLIVFPNVPAQALDLAQMRAVRDAVFNQGTGFLMLGGENGFGPGGYHKTPVEEALPVTMDSRQRKVIPKGALAIVLHTCEFADGNTWAKRVAKEAIRVLNPGDLVGALDYSYDRNPSEGWIFPLTPAKEYERLATLINKATPGDMPAFQPTMQLAHDALAATNVSSRHVIIISDGDPSAPLPALISAYQTAKITVSTVAISPHGGTTVPLMQAIATQTGGRFYRTDDPTQLPSIFIKEARTLRRSMMQNRTFVPAKDMPSPIMKGFTGLPELDGYVIVTPKETATVALTVPPSEADRAEAPDALPDPLLAVWNHGIGRTAAWTSDLAPTWGKKWLGWEGFKPWVRQLTLELGRREVPSNLSVVTQVTGDRAVIDLDDTLPDATGLTVRARVSGPGDRVEEVVIPTVAPRRYRATFPTWGVGRYQVSVGATGAGRVERVSTGFVVSYSPEYLRFRSQPLLLRAIAERSGGRLLSATDPVFSGFARTPREKSRPVFDWLLIALAILLPLDVALRRVQFDIVGWFKRIANRGPSIGAGSAPATLERLLKTKGEPGTDSDDKRSSPPLRIPKKSASERPSTPRPPRAAVAPAPPPSPPSPKPSTPSAGPKSTADRLLARKRRKQSGDSEQGSSET